MEMNVLRWMLGWTMVMDEVNWDEEKRSELGTGQTSTSARFPHCLTTGHANMYAYLYDGCMVSREGFSIM